MTHTLESELVKHLSDAYSLEQQALAQLRTAPRRAGHRELDSAFRVHLAETEVQSEMVRERLEAHGASPSKIKDAVMALGGKAFVLFARVQPDTPGKLAVHAYSYEALEWAAYDLLMRMARRAGDPESVSYARTIRDQEGAMMERLQHRGAPRVERKRRIGDQGLCASPRRSQLESLLPRAVRYAREARRLRLRGGAPRDRGLRAASPRGGGGARPARVRARREDCR
jgi:ferritin-like metal-binding protein YciE